MDVAAGQTEGGIMGLPIIGSVLSTVGRLVLPVLGKIGKGKATVTGVGLVGIATAIAALLPELATGLQDIADSIVAVVQALGTALALFGVGRKAGAV